MAPLRLLALALWLLAAILALGVSAEEDVVAVEPKHSSSHWLSGLGGDWKFAQYKNYIYTYFFDDFLTWDDAWHFCLNHGGQLVAIESKGEQKVLERLLRGTDPSHDHDIIWTSGRFDDQCEVYEWWYNFILHKIFFQTDGHTRYSYQYTNWWHGEPDHDCVGLSVEHNNFGKWVTEDCDIVYAYICEWNECQRWSWDPDHCQHQHGCWYDFDTDHCQRIKEVHPPAVG